MKLSEVIAKYSSQDEFISVLKSEVIKLGTENSDFIYNPGFIGSCSYSGPAYRFEFDDELCDYVQIVVGPECKGCIFGQAMQNMGWDNEEEMPYFGSISTVLLNHGFHDKEIRVFQEVQSNQDSGASWGEAIKQLLEV